MSSVTRAPRSSCLRWLVEVGGELRERRELAVLREREAHAAPSFLMMLVCAAPPTRETEMPALIGAHAGVEEIRFQEDLPVGDRDHVVGTRQSRRRPGFR